MELFEVLEKRRSVRKYTDQKVEKEKVEKLLEAALRIPSGHGAYPLHYIVIEDEAVLAALKDLRVEGKGQIIANAPLAIAILADTDKSVTWIEDASCAAENIYLAAEEMGLGTCWIQVRVRNSTETETADAFAKKLFGYPDNIQTECIMAIGYPAEHAPAKTKEDLCYNMVHYDKF